MKLARAFFLQPTLDVAENLLGKNLVYHSAAGKIVGEINEVESYIGMDDLASHAAKGRTIRNEKMFGVGGFSYVYFIYGMYYCLNIVTEKENFPAAILIRSVIPKTGLELMCENRGKKWADRLINNNISPHKVLAPLATSIKDIRKLSNGPGKLCQAYGFTKIHNGIDLVTSEKLYIEDSGKKITNFTKTPRIGIKVGLDQLWRYYYK